jgi:RNA polymerase sigma-70 factor (ECF subfamily)
MEDDEDALVRAATKGDANALTRLLERHGPRVEKSLDINIIWRTALEPADVMQVTYLEAFLQIRRFDPDRGTPFEAWLRRIAQNNLRDAIRGLERLKQPQPRNRVRPTSREDSLIGLYDLLGSDSATPSRNLRRSEVSARVAEAIETLPDRYREIVKLYDLEGLTMEEVAARTGRSPGALYMLRARAHDRLRGELGELTFGT